MQEVGSASTQALRSIQQAHQAAALNLATKGPTKTTTTLAISAAGRACLSRNHLGSPGGVEWQEGEEPRRGREERASSALLPRSKGGSPPSAISGCGGTRRAVRWLPQEKRPFLLSLPYEAALLSPSRHGGGDGAAGGAADERWSRTDNAVLQALSPPPSRRRASAVRTQQRPTLSRGGKNHLKGKEAARACPTCWAPQNGWVSASMPTARRDNKAQEA